MFGRDVEAKEEPLGPCILKKVPEYDGKNIDGNMEKEWSQAVSPIWKLAFLLRSLMSLI